MRAILVIAPLLLFTACSRRPPSLSSSPQATPSTTPSATDAEPDFAAPRLEAVGELLSSMRAQLPKGWSASYNAESSWLEVSRDEDVLATVVVECGPPRQEETRNKFVFAFRVMARMNPSEYRRLTAENAVVEKEISKLHEDLDKMRIREKLDFFAPQTDEQKRAVARYEVLKDSLHELPDFYFGDTSLEWGYGAPDMPLLYVSDAGIRDECTTTRNKILQLLSKYKSA